MFLRFTCAPSSCPAAGTVLRRWGAGGGGSCPRAPGPSSVESHDVLPTFWEPGGKEEEEVSEKCLAAGHWVCSKPRLCSRCGIVGVPDRWTDTVRPQGQWGRGVGLGTHVW